MSESSGNKIEIHTEGGTVIAGGTFTNVEFVANKYVYGGCGQEPEAGAQTADAEAEAGMPVAVIPPQLDTEPARNLLRRAGAGRLAGRKTGNLPTCRTPRRAYWPACTDCP